MSPDLSGKLMRHWALPELEGNESRPVAWRGGQPITREVFYRDLAAARQRLLRAEPGDVAGRPGFALLDSDVYRFSVWLLAAWSLGLVVVLPGDDLPATKAALNMPWIGSDPTSPSSATDHEEDVDVDHGTPGVMLFTSGSTGKPSLVEKTLRQLRAEAEMFEKAFGERLSTKTRFVASVPHQHMYGFPFFVLWPLTAGHAITVERLRYPEDLGRLPPADYVLISAPTFLKHLPDAPSPAPGLRWQMATSAGSPLALEVARQGAAYLSAPLFEIYGSTETGATARRQGDAPWQAMPGVRLSLDAETSRLRIHSPLLSDAEMESGYLSGDLARLDEHGLVLQGRADRLVKIGEKRISLTQIEQELALLPEVDSARVVPLPHEHESDRLILGVVIVLSPEGWRRHGAEKKVQFDASLRNRLRDRLDPLALPRRWRYVEAFPCNEMGKTTRQDLEKLFAPFFPHVEQIPQDPADAKPGVEKCVLRLRVPHNLAWFEGHFPGAPVLPGVVQVDWAAWFARLYFGFDAEATNVSNLKFQRVVLPGDVLRLELSLRREKGELEFIYTVDEKTCLRAVFMPRGPDVAGAPS